MRLLSYMSPGFPTSLFEALGRVLDADVIFDEERSGPAPGVDPFADGSADLGWICSTSFVDLTTRRDDPSIVLAGVAWVPDDPDVAGRPVYFGDVVTRPDSAIDTFDDLRGARIGCNDEVSLSGHHSLRFALHDRGLGENFVEIVFTGGHQRSLDLVVAGELDAAVVDSVVRTRRSRVDTAVAGLRIVERLGPWPVQPLVARSTLKAAEIDDVRRRLLEASSHPDVVAELRGAALSHLVEVDARHYEPVRDAIHRSAGLGPSQ